MLYPIELRVQNASRLKRNRLGNRPDVKHGLVEDLTTIDACSSTAMLRYGNQPTKSGSATVLFRNSQFQRILRPHALRYRRKSRKIRKTSREQQLKVVPPWSKGILALIL